MGVHAVPTEAKGWHEDHLVIEVLRFGPQSVNQVWEAVHSKQAAKMETIAASPHTKSNFRQRIKCLIDSGILLKDDKNIILTNMGKWVANSTLLDQDQRVAFLDAWICKNCTKIAGHAVLYTPVLETAKTTSKGWRLDALCPCCGQTSKYMPIPENMDLNTFVEYFSNVTRELMQYSK
jgi:hypothetical protein